MWVSKTAEACSKMGFTMVMYEMALTLVEQSLMFHRRTARTLFVFSDVKLYFLTMSSYQPMTCQGRYLLDSDVYIILYGWCTMFLVLVCFSLACH